MGQRLNPFGVLQVVHLVRQDLSIAGKRAGLAGERSGLFMEQVRIVKEMRERDRRNGRTGDMVRPRFLVWENVPGAFSSNGGGDFQAVLEEIIHIAEPTVSVPRFEGKWTKAGAIDGDGWSVAWRTHDAQYWGVPQRRRRISVVADFGGQSAGEILFERKSVSGHLAESGAARERLAGNAESGASYAVRIRGGCDGGGKGALVQTEKSGTLGTGNDQTIFCPAVVALDMSHACDVIRDCGEIVPSLQARMGTGGNQVPLTYQMQGFGDYRAGEVASSCKQRDFKDGTDLAITNMAVRRLTPVECERLQGFPDGWTDIGEWVDEEGRTHKQADSPRYKALGNSIALPFWYWMFCRMAEHFPGKATLGSLFDGIGGFPLCWESIHGKGTARWASEIEKFPMAVTKLRFPEEA
jgi:DNA (cytosine-5)-methyltransferase 1|nr:MAG TPA: Cytosine specific methyltransferase [Caudoviricetes sp.]